jgi:hypothetical protein
MKDHFTENYTTEIKVFPVHVTKAYRGSSGIAPLILNFGARWRFVVNIMLQLLYRQEKTSVPNE